MGPYATIMLGDTECAVNGHGLNIVVYDNETQLVIDSVAFDTGTPEKTAVRNWSNIYDYLRTYEEVVCFAKDGAA